MGSQNTLKNNFCDRLKETVILDPTNITLTDLGIINQLRHRITLEQKSVSMFQNFMLILMSLMTVHLV